MIERLTTAELQTLINVIAQTSVPVGQVQPFIDLINKLSRMVDEIKQEEESQE